MSSRMIMMMRLAFVVSLSLTFDLQAKPRTDRGDGEEVRAGSVPAEQDMVKVIARGVGANKVEALKDAYRDAVERAIGLYVDADTMVQNDKVISNQILTHSNAYVAKYDENEMKELPNGLVQIRITAFVLKRQVAASLKKVDPKNEINLGGSLSDVHAQLTSEKKRVKDAAALFKSKLEGVDPIRSLIHPTIRLDSRVVTKAGKVPPGSKNHGKVPSGKVALSYVIAYQLDLKRYKEEFLPLLKDVLGQISTKPPRKIRMSTVEGRWDVISLEDYLSADVSKRVIMKPPRDGGMYERLFVYEGILDGQKMVFKPYQKLGMLFNRADHDTMLQNRFSHEGFFAGEPCRDDGEWEQGDVIVIDDWNGKMTSAKATVYNLDASCTGVLACWMRQLGCRGHNSTPSSSNFVVSFVDGNGEEVISFNESVAKCALMNVGSAASRNFVGERSPGIECDDYLVSPFVGCAGQTFLKWYDFVMDEDELAQTKSIKIESLD